jgi:hypothetical protein
VTVARAAVGVTEANEAGRVPTFVSVEFYDVGDLFGVVRKAGIAASNAPTSS